MEDDLASEKSTVFDIHVSVSIDTRLTKILITNIEGFVRRAFYTRLGITLHEFIMALHDLSC